MKPDSSLRRLAEPLPDHVPDWPRVEASAGLRRAALIATDGVVITRSGEEIGIVTAASLLKALATDEDPVTGLPRSGALRDWMGEQLSVGKEIAVLFFDLDAFGEINKAYGHAEGDAALARAASVVRSLCTGTDFPARFGGDEFAIGTLRDREGAESLAGEVSDRLISIGLSSSVGVAGGRRKAMRAETNVQAVVEDLLTLASLDCLSHKPEH